MDDKTVYKTLVRVAGSFSIYPMAVRAVLHHYGWNRAVLLGDREPIYFCTYASKAIMDIVGNSVIHDVQMRRDATRSDIIASLNEVKQNGRGK